MKNTILLSLLIVSNFAMCQTFDWSWTKRPYGVEQEVGYGVATDNFGNIYVTGAFSTDTIFFANDTITNKGNWDSFIFKYNSSGDEIWAKSAGGTNGDLSNGIAVDNNGEVYITGESFSTTMDFGNLIQTTNYGNDDIFIAKYDSSGNAIWAKSVGGSSDADAGESVVTDNLNYVYVTGMFSSASITFDNNTITNTGNPSVGDIFIAKYDPNGNCIWAKSAGGNGNDFGMSITCDNNYNIYITGNYDGSPADFDNISLSSNSGIDVFVAKYDSSGSAIWAERAGGGLQDFGKGITTDEVGSIYVVGNFNSSSINFGSDNLINAGVSSPDIFIAKYDTLGNPLWANSAGGNSNEGGNGVSTDNYGSVFIIGDFESSTITFGNATLTNGGLPDIFIAQYDTAGNVVTAKRAGGNNYDYGNAIANDLEGSVYLTGDFNSTSATFGNDVLTRSNLLTATTDVFLSKLSIDIGVGLNEIVNEIKIYPNPVMSEITVSGYSPAYLKLCDAVGQTVAESKSNKLYVGNLSQGLYVLQVFDEKGQPVKTEKVIVAK